VAYGGVREIEDMLDGCGDVIVLADPSRDVIQIDESGVPDGFTGVLVSTSGSTGTPKTVMLSRDALIGAANASLDRLGGPGAWANPLPGWYVAGLMTVVRGLVAGMGCTTLSPHLEDLRPARGTAYISLVPAQLHRALSDKEIRRSLASYSAVLVGGAHLNDALRAQAEQAGITVVTTYGMSETCGGVVYDGVPLSGVEIQLLDEDGLSPGAEGRGMYATAGDNRTQDDPRRQKTTLPSFCATDEGPNGPDSARDGRIRIISPTVFDGYLGDPEQTAWVRHGNSFLTNDRGRLLDGRLTVMGRVDDVVQSGGTNVDLAEIQHLLDAGFPHQVACFAQPDPVWGSTVIVASTGPSLDQIWTKLAPHLDSAARPRGILHVGALPRTSSGKIDRETMTKMWRNSGERA